MTTIPSPAGTRLLRLRNLTVLVPVRAAVGCTLLAALLVVAAAAALSVGTASVGPLRSLAALVGVGDAADVLVVQRLRLPRLQAGLLVGTALGVSGCLMQTLARNRLATPGTVGIDDGATAFAVASVVGVSTSLLPSGMALVGAATAAALALALAGGAGTSGYRFVVVGLGVGAVLGAVTNLLLVRAPIDAANAAFPWAVGSLNARPALPVTLLGVGLAGCLPLAVLVGHRLTALRFPDTVAAGLGVRVRAVRLAALALAVVCAGPAVAVGGPLGLVALVAPEAARRVCGPRGVPVLSSGLAGAVLVLLADTAGRTVAAPVEVPVGLVTSIVGGPYLVWLLLSSRPRRLP
ncbi:FecCD family ABC transporter permease [Planosporangium mesophilum]|uniref:Ferric enterobactin transporter FepG n=1 Tax=Planosporangium mesophilum TaxID=689768 RepID=A0A8J3TH52_9ACTN|nr:iron ABC transporter permease [Planosporangium mesophilum]NJC86857.1 iron ABC transporter permease [Planosporangium mesophilum]GII26368.1 ferric enterobactin transporter FepG [Planosporangium mesophilum]